MASNKFQGGKCKGGGHAKALLRHNEISVESREIAAKENPHIDISKSHLNFSLDGLTYSQRCRKYDKRIKDLDETTNTNKRKDRVTMQGIEVPVPEGLPEEQYRNWFEDVYEIYKNQFGAENVISFDVHVDEVHDYIHAVTGEWTTSRVHAHCGIVPEVDGVLNGKAFASRKNMRILNKAIEEMTNSKYGCKFQTGEKTKSKETLDQLKNKSAELELEEQEQQISYEWTTINTEKRQLKQGQKQLEADREAFEADKAEYRQKTAEALKKALSVLQEGKKLHENLKFQSQSYCDAPISKIQEKKLVELDKKLELAYELANQQRDEDKQYG